MSKSKFIRHNFFSKTNIALICILIAVFGFLYSRAFLSFGIFSFGINALRDIHPRRWIKNKWWLLGVCWVAAYAISWFWTDDKANWSERFDVKLPILLLPLAFSFIPAFSIRQLRIFTVVTAMLLFTAVAYSLYFFVQAPGAYIYEYSVSHGLPTLAGGDHIRISLFIAMFILWCFYFMKYAHGAMKWFTGVTAFIFIVFLHILAARTGLVALYVFILLFAAYLGIRKNKALGIGLAVFLLLVGVFSYNFFPTLRNKIGYFEYTVIEYKRSGLQGHYSDMGRFISYDIALRKIGQNMLLGVGAGDILNEMKEGYDRWYPGVSEEKRLVPHNQFLIVALGCGVPVLLLFTAWILMPLRGLRRNRAGFYFFAAWLVLLLPLMIEPMLEVQFGVFVYLFFLLWQRHVMLHEPVAEV